MSTDTPAEETGAAEYGADAPQQDYGYDAGVQPEAETEYFTDDGDDDDPPDADEVEGDEPEADESAAEEKGGEATPLEQPLSRSEWAEVGLTEEKARALDAAGLLGDTIDLVVRRTVAVGERALAAERPAPVQAAPVQAAPAAAVPPAPPAAPPAAEPAGLFELQATAEDAGEALMGDLTETRKAIGSQASALTALSNELAEVRKSLQSQRAAEETRALDQFFDSQPDEFKEFFGKGPLSGFREGSAEAELRLEVAAAAFNLVAGAEAIGGNVPSFDAAMNMAKHAVLGDKAREIARKQVETRARDAKGQYVAKPTHRDAKPAPVGSAAAERAEQIYKQRGL